MSLFAEKGREMAEGGKVEKQLGNSWKQVGQKLETSWETLGKKRGETVGNILNNKLGNRWEQFGKH